MNCMRRARSVLKGGGWLRRSSSGSDIATIAAAAAATNVPSAETNSSSRRPSENVEPARSLSACCLHPTNQKSPARSPKLQQPSARDKRQNAKITTSNADTSANDATAAAFDKPPHAQKGSSSSLCGFIAQSLAGSQQKRHQQSTATICTMSRKHQLDCCHHHHDQQQQQQQACEQKDIASRPSSASDAVLDETLRAGSDAYQTNNNNNKENSSMQSLPTIASARRPNSKQFANTRRKSLSSDQINPNATAQSVLDSLKQTVLDRIASNLTSDERRIVQLLEEYAGERQQQQGNNSSQQNDNQPQQRQNKLYELGDSWSSFVLSAHSDARTQIVSVQQEAIWELLTSELDYLRRIEVLINVFVRPLEHLQQGHALLIEVSFTALFGNIIQVHASSDVLWREHLLVMLDEARASRSPMDPMRIHAAFVNARHTFKPYFQYTLEHIQRLRYARALYNDNKLFRFFVDRCEARKQCARLRLTDLLAEPMQRLTKYKLLLERIKKQTASLCNTAAAVSTDLIDPVSAGALQQRKQQLNALAEMITFMDKFVTVIDLELLRHDEAELLAECALRIERAEPSSATATACAVAAITAAAATQAADYSRGTVDIMGDEVERLIRCHDNAFDPLAPLFATCPLKCQRQLLFDSSSSSKSGTCNSSAFRFRQVAQAGSGASKFIDVTLLLFSDSLLVCKSVATAQHEPLCNRADNQMNVCRATSFTVGSQPFLHWPVPGLVTTSVQSMPLSNGSAAAVGDGRKHQMSAANSDASTRPASFHAFSESMSEANAAAGDAAASAAAAAAESLHVPALATASACHLSAMSAGAFDRAGLKTRSLGNSADFRNTSSGSATNNNAAATSSNISIQQDQQQQRRVKTVLRPLHAPYPIDRLVVYELQSADERTVLCCQLNENSLTVATSFVIQLPASFRAPFISASAAGLSSPCVSSTSSTSSPPANGRQKPQPNDSSRSDSDSLAALTTTTSEVKQQSPKSNLHPFARSFRRLTTQATLSESNVSTNSLRQQQQQQQDQSLALRSAASHFVLLLRQAQLRYKLLADLHGARIAEPIIRRNFEHAAAQHNQVVGRQKMAAPPSGLFRHKSGSSQSSVDCELIAAEHRTWRQNSSPLKSLSKSIRASSWTKAHMSSAMSSLTSRRSGSSRSGYIAAVFATPSRRGRLPFLSPSSSSQQDENISSNSIGGCGGSSSNSTVALEKANADEQMLRALQVQYQLWLICHEQHEQLATHRYEYPAAGSSNLLDERPVAVPLQVTVRPVSAPSAAENDAKQQHTTTGSESEATSTAAGLHVVGSRPARTTSSRRNLSSLRRQNVIMSASSELARPPLKPSAAEPEVDATVDQQPAQPQQQQQRPTANRQRHLLTSTSEPTASANDAGALRRRALHGRESTAATSQATTTDETFELDEPTTSSTSANEHFRPTARLRDQISVLLIEPDGARSQLAESHAMRARPASAHLSKSNPISPTPVRAPPIQRTGRNNPMRFMRRVFRFGHAATEPQRGSFVSTSVQFNSQDSNAMQHRAPSEPPSPASRALYRNTATKLAQRDSDNATSRSLQAIAYSDLQSSFDFNALYASELERLTASASPDVDLSLSSTSSSYPPQYSGFHEKIEEHNRREPDGSLHIALTSASPTPTAQSGGSAGALYTMAGVDSDKRNRLRSSTHNNSNNSSK